MDWSLLFLEEIDLGFLSGEQCEIGREDEGLFILYLDLRIGDLQESFL